MQSHPYKSTAAAMGSTGSHYKVSLILAMAIVVIVAGLYVSALDNPFMMDDHIVIVNNPDVTEPGRLARRWTNDVLRVSASGGPSVTTGDPRQLSAQFIDYRSVADSFPVGQYRIIGPSGLPV